MHHADLSDAILHKLEMHTRIGRLCESCNERKKCMAVLYLMCFFFFLEFRSVEPYSIIMISMTVHDGAEKAVTFISA